MARSLEKSACLLFLMQEILEKASNAIDQTIIFAATRYHVEFLYELTQAAGFKSTYIFGAMD